MSMCKRLVFRNLGLMSACLIFTGSRVAFAQPSLAQAAPEPTAQAPAVARPVGTIKSISGNTIILTTDAGSDVTIQVQDSTKLVRIAPGQKDLKDATPIQLADIQPGDRILVRGKLADDGKSVVAASVIAMKKGDIADKQAHEREEWQRHGLEGLVIAVDNIDRVIQIIRASKDPDEAKAALKKLDELNRAEIPGQEKGPTGDANPKPDTP